MPRKYSLQTLTLDGSLKLSKTLDTSLPKRPPNCLMRLLLNVVQIPLISPKQTKTRQISHDFTDILSPAAAKGTQSIAKVKIPLQKRSRNRVTFPFIESMTGSEMLRRDLFLTVDKISTNLLQYSLGFTCENVKA